MCMLHDVTQFGRQAHSLHCVSRRFVDLNHPRTPLYVQKCYGHLMVFLFYFLVTHGIATYNTDQQQTGLVYRWVHPCSYGETRDAPHSIAETAPIYCNRPCSCVLCVLKFSDELFGGGLNSNI